jgi:hypothetical protein
MGPAARPAAADGAAEERPLLRWSQLARAVPLGVALLAAVVMYWPALNSAFFADDFLYLSAAKSMSFAHFSRLALVPNSEAAAATFHIEFWRPLAVLTLGVEWHLFGGHVLAYHLVNLAIHLSALALAWALCARLSGRWEAGGIAALVFALHPAGFAAVSWVSSVNSAALPFALAGWLYFVYAVGKPGEPTKRGFIVASVALFAVALGFRETAVTVIAGLAIWFVLVRAREDWRRWRTYLPLAPYAALMVAYYVLRTRLLTDPAVEPRGYRVGSEVPSEAWFYLKLALFPFGHHSETWRDVVAAVGGVIVLAAIPLAAWCRKWLLAALLLSLVVAVLPYSALILGVQARYFYVPSAFVALAAGTAGVMAVDVLRRVAAAHWVAAAGVSLAVVATVVGVAVGRGRVNDWLAGDPAVQNSWVAQLRARYPTLPSGGTLYAVNTPLLLALFDNVLLAPTVSYYYPQVAQTVRVDAQDVSAVQKKLGPNDRVFVFDPTR